MILGKCVSNYKHGDKVVFITKDFNVKEGLIYFPVELSYSDEYTIYSENRPFTRKDVRLLCNTQDNEYYAIKTNELYKGLFENLEKRLKQAECQHNWVGKEERLQCSKCFKSDWQLREGK